MSMRTQIDFRLGSRAARPRSAGEPLRVLVLADFTGRSQLPATLSARRIEIDEFDSAIGALAPVVPVAAPDDGKPLAQIAITTLAQLHPDHLAVTLPHLRELLELDGALRDPRTEKQALATLDSLAGAATTARAPAATSANVTGEDEPDESSDQLLGRLLGSARRDDAGQRAAKARVQQLIDSALGSAASAGSSSQAVDGRARLARIFNDRCRRILLDPRFRSVERAWRSVHWLASRLEGDDAHLYVADLSKEALAQHVAELGQNLDASPLHRLLARDADDRWDLIVGDYSFALTADDVTLLATLGALAARARAPFLAHGELGLAGCASAEDADAPWDWRYADADLAALWNELRAHPAARWLGLATPRFLLRLPYGSKGDAIERFEFEELPVRPERERFLWGNPAFACALLVARAHARGDGTYWPNAGGSVDDLPMPVYSDGGGEAVQPPIELVLGERARATATDRGLIALAGGSNANRISVPSTRCLANG
jgi:type VI secretion system ImpC/EvpB family protein